MERVYIEVLTDYTPSTDEGSEGLRVHGPGSEGATEVVQPAVIVGTVDREDFPYGLAVGIDQADEVEATVHLKPPSPRCGP